MITAFFDGACGPNNPGGHVGIGGIIREGHEVLHQFSEHFSPDKLGPTSNNLAEHMAFQQIIDWLLKNSNDREPIRIYGDSSLVVNQMNLRYRIKSGVYIDVAKESIKMMEKFTRRPLVIWIPREQNTEADNLSKLRLKERGIST